MTTADLDELALSMPQATKEVSFVERANAGDAAGIAALYEEDAVMAYTPGKQTAGRDAIRALWERALADRRIGQDDQR